MRLPTQAMKSLPTSGVKPLLASADVKSLENLDYRIALDPARGVVTSIFDKHLNREFISPGGSGNRLEIHWENPRESSAWTIGKIDRVQPLVDPVTPVITENGLTRITISWDRKFQSSILHQSLSLTQSGPPIFSLDTKWDELGGVDRHEPFLKVAFDVNAEHPTATYQVPFATIQKPIDGEEHPASKFADLSSDGFGAAILNDCKQGYSADSHTLDLSLIRSRLFPRSSCPNDKPQHASYRFSCRA